MTFQWIGLVAAAAIFFGIWFGHVAVRKIEAQAKQLWLPMAVAFGLGISLEFFSLFTENRLLATATGILGVTLLWDSFEFWRQENRVRKGHTPANPQNPRHARILAENETATTLDLLNRDPVGRPVDAQEAIQLITEN